MSKKNQKKVGNDGAKIHTNVLRPSGQAVREMVEAIEPRFLEICDLHLRVKGEPIVPPSELDRDMFNWRRVTLRHRKGDYRHTNDEAHCIKRVAQWTLDVKCDLTGNERIVLE